MIYPLDSAMQRLNNRGQVSIIIIILLNTLMRDPWAASTSKLSACVKNKVDREARWLAQLSPPEWTTGFDTHLCGLILIDLPALLS